MTIEEAIAVFNSLAIEMTAILAGIPKNESEAKQIQRYIDAYDMAISALRQQEHRCPCDLCNFGPPSSMRGKSCTMCPAVPKQETVTERNELTNADRINAMTVEEKAEFLSSIAYGTETPWSEPFADKFCKGCPTTTCTAGGYHHPMDLHECDFVDGKCPHGSDIVWWLQQPAESTGQECCPDQKEGDY